MKSSAIFTKDGELILIDLDEILCLEGNEVIFRGNDHVYTIGDKTVEALRKAFSDRIPA